MTMLNSKMPTGSGSTGKGKLQIRRDTDMPREYPDEGRVKPSRRKHAVDKEEEGCSPSGEGCSRSGTDTGPYCP